MQLKKLYPVAALLLILCLPSMIAAGSNDEERKKAAAISAAEDFLLLIDTGQYGKSWDMAASLFRERVPKETWVRQVGSVRPGLGETIRREIVGAEYMTAMPGAPDGEYVVVTYRSAFARKKDAVETVTPMLDRDGEWRVSGYYIR
jgi:hypothetical protein